jgi:hypothetical protein
MDLQGLIAKLGMFWPEGDPGRLRQAATAYRQCARDLAAVQAGCQSTVTLVQGHDQGPPIDAFAAWAARWQGNPGYFPATMATCNQLADACDAYAQRIDDAHARIIELATAAAAALAVGLALTVFTFGASDGVAGVTVAGLVAASLAEGTALSAAAAGIVVAVGVGALEGMVFDGMVQLEATAVFHDQKGFNWAEFGQSAAFGAVTGGLGAGAGMGLARVGARLLPSLADASPTVARTFTTLGRIPAPLREGATGLLTGTGISAGFDLATTGHLNPDDLLIGGLSGLAGGLAAGSAEPAGLTRGAGGGFRTSRFYKLSAAEIDQLTRDFESIGGNPKMLRFNKGTKTGYVDEVDLIYVRGDVLPTTNPAAIDPNTTMSARAALAHELGHQAFTGTKLGVGDPRDEIRASIWAAQNVTKLSNPERTDLLLDALQRARTAGDWDVVSQLNTMLQKPVIKWHSFQLNIPWLSN